MASVTHLEGCRILELGGYVAAPFATLVLGHLGAEVIKVESLAGDPARATVSNFVANNCGKSSIAIDLGNKKSRNVWKRLVESADVIIHNLDQRATRRLGVGYEECRLVNHKIVYCHIRAFGKGPYEEMGATNPIVEALTGLMSITWSDGRPTRQALPFCDQMTGLFAALSVVIALAAPDDRVESKYIEANLFETGLFSVAPRLVDYAINRELQGPAWGTAPYTTFQTRDGYWIFLGVVNDSLWRSFCAAFDLADLGADPSLAHSQQRSARKSYVDRIAGEAIKRLSRVEALSRLRAAGIPSAPVYDFSETLLDEHVRSTGKLYSASFGGLDALLPEYPVVTDGAAHVAGLHVPLLGENSVDVITDLGFGVSEVSSLKASGVIKVPLPVLVRAALWLFSHGQRRECGHHRYCLRGPDGLAAPLSPPPAPGLGGAVSGGGSAEQVSQQKLNAQLTRAWWAHGAGAMVVMRSSGTPNSRAARAVCVPYRSMAGPRGRRMSRAGPPGSRSPACWRPVAACSRASLGGG